MKFFRSSLLSIIPVSLGYFLLHLPSLTLLPVFADEAIYIRWAQLIEDDLPRYAFFSMADGKPPLFMWLLALTLKIPLDPLFVARATSVVIGLIGVIVARALIREFTSDSRALLFTTLASSLLPFSYLYHRLALMDGLLTLFISLSFLFALKLSKRPHIFPFVGLTLSFGLSLMTKTPALFAIPIIALCPLFIHINSTKVKLSSLLRPLMLTALAGALGFALFFTLRFSPLFGALFTRSTDFTFSLNQILAGEWRFILTKSFPRNFTWLVAYLTPTLFILSFLGLALKKVRRPVLFLIICSLLFLTPLTLFGRVLWPRYFLPSSIFLILAAALAFASSLNIPKLKIATFILTVATLIYSLIFIGLNLTNPARVPFVAEDKIQYLNEWSAGYGNSQVRDFIVSRQQALSETNKKVIVLTEGTFGTLPDGLLMYFHNYKSPRSLEIHGIGVSVPVIPSEYLTRAATNEVYYVVNSHRLGLVPGKNMKLLFFYPRPSGPSLDLYQIYAP